VRLFRWLLATFLRGSPSQVVKRLLLYSRLVLLQSLSARLALELPAGASSFSLMPKYLMFRFREDHQRFSNCSPPLLKLMAPPTRNSADVPVIWCPC